MSGIQQAPWWLGLLLVFLAGAAYEACCAYWVHYSERDAAEEAALCSMGACLVTVFGIEESIHWWPSVVAFVFGYGAGTWAVIKVKTYRKKRGAVR